MISSAFPKINNGKLSDDVLNKSLTWLNNNNNTKVQNSSFKFF